MFKYYIINVDIYNPKDEFLNNICFPYVNKSVNADMTLSNRRSDTFVNVSFCDNGCDYSNIDYNTSKVTCNCSKDKDLIDKEEEKSFSFGLDLLSSTNILLFTCYNQLFVLSKIKNNIGFYFGGAIFLIDVIFFIPFIVHRLGIIYTALHAHLFTIQSKNQNSTNTTNSCTGTERATVKIILKKTECECKEEVSYEEEKELEKEIDNIDSCDYKNAIIHDKRGIFTIFYSFFIQKVEFISIFFFPSQFDIFYITLSSYLFSIISDFTMNALFFSDSVISERYENSGKLPFLTTLIVTIFSKVIGYLFGKSLFLLTNYSPAMELLVEYKNEEKQLLKKASQCIKIIKMKITLFFIFEFIFVGIFWYYLCIFCNVFRGSQINWFSDGIFSILISLSILLSMTIVISIRTIGIKCKCKCLYNISLYLNK